METPRELAEAIADLVGVYGGGPEEGDHPSDCKCRMCFVSEMEERIRGIYFGDEELHGKMEMVNISMPVVHLCRFQIDELEKTDPELAEMARKSRRYINSLLDMALAEIDKKGYH